MKTLDKVRVRGSHAWPWPALVGKEGQVVIRGRRTWGVTFPTEALWYTPLPGESRVFYFDESDLEVVP